jgi:PAS domain S-box-containing protein
MEENSIRVLLIEDSPGDARLIREMLAEVRDTYFNVEHADRLSTGLERLATGDFDVILSDLSLPDCQGFDTFVKVRAQAPQVPIVVLSGLDDETLGFTAVREGAQDYLVKGQADGNLLKRSIRYAIERRLTQEELRRSEERYRSLIESAVDAIFTVEPDGTVTSLNPAFEAITGWACSDWMGKKFLGLLHPDDLPSATLVFEALSQGAPSQRYEGRILSKSGHYIVMEFRAAPQIDNGQLVGIFGIGRDITERKQAQERLQELYEREKELRQELGERTTQVENAYLKLYQLDQMKDSFLSTVSHELRTPLTSIKGFAEILLSYEEEDKETQREFLTIINEESDRLTRLINDLLDLSRIESGRMEWQTNNLAVRDVIEIAINSTHALAAQKQINVSVDVGPGLPPFLGDKDRLVQVMTNLLGNATKFTPEGGGIGVKAELLRGEGPSPAQDAIRVSVSDTGIGIAPENCEKVFDKFRQIGDTLTDKPKGTGLGLAICKEIAEHYGGTIWVESELGRGSTFFFTLPIAGTAGDQVSGTEGEKGKNGLEGGKTILVVDDEANIRKFLRHELASRGYQVVEALGGTEAIDLARKHHPDLITLDVDMPDINGYDVTALLKSDPQTSDIPILIVSVADDKQRGYSLGVSDYLTKPIDVKSLTDKVARLLSPDNERTVPVVQDESTLVKTIASELQNRGFAARVGIDGEEGSGEVGKARNEP